MKIILASKSPRRKELLELINIKYEAIESNSDEVYNNNLDFYHQIQEIGYNKALNVFNRTDGDRIVIGSDTVVIFNNKVLGKPKTKEDAKNMLRELSGNTHEVVTSICACVYKDNQTFEEKDYSITKVTFDNLTDDEIDYYVNKYPVCDWAGAYAIQGEFSKHIKSFNGDYFTIVGLPLNKTYNLIKKYEEF